MKVWRAILLLVIAATAAAFGWHWVADDPGYVLVRLRGWRVETTVVAAVLVVLVAWVLASTAWRLLRWPFGAFTRRHQRVSQQRLNAGLVALIEGRHVDAERDLNRAARLGRLRGLALLASAEAALQRGELTRALEALDQAAQTVPVAARVLRARVLRRDGKDAEALALLASDADKGTLPPNGWRELALAALAVGNPARARSALAPLKKSAALGSRAYATLEAQVVTAAIDAAADGAALDTLWMALPKAQRRPAPVVLAYARRAADMGRLLAATDELESALRREWSAPLITAYAALPAEDVEARLRRAEGWLDAHPNDPALHVALGRLATRARAWNKARGYLQRALALDAGAPAWEALGDALADEGHPEPAQRCYRNAFAAARGESVQPWAAANPNPAWPDTHSITVEERDQHGVPRLPR